MEFIILLLLAAVALAVWRFIKRAYWGARIRHLTRTGDPVIMDLHEHTLRKDWYSLDPGLRAAMAVAFLQDPDRAYAEFKTGGSNLQLAEFRKLMTNLIRNDPACLHIRGESAG